MLLVSINARASACFRHRNASQQTLDTRKFHTYATYRITKYFRGFREIPSTVLCSITIEIRAGKSYPRQCAFFTNAPESRIISAEYIYIYYSICSCFLLLPLIDRIEKVDKQNLHFGSVEQAFSPCFYDTMFVFFFFNFFVDLSEKQ